MSMMIIDFNQVAISNIMVSLGSHTNAKVDVGMLRHMILNSVRGFREKFGNDYPETVVACDNTNIWRKKVFPYYKANRKKAKDNSDMDWGAIFECLNKIRDELKEFFPYKVIDIESAEADDIIGTLVHEFGTELNTGEKILILSADKDFIQLHTYGNVKQYDPIRKRWVSHNDPDQYLLEHILKGDSGDGIPNVLSADNCFVVGNRQKPLTQKKIDSIISSDIENSDIGRNYYRNSMLINLVNTPKDIQEKVMIEYNKQNKDRSKLMNYFMQHKLKNLMQDMGAF